MTILPVSQDNPQNQACGAYSTPFPRVLVAFGGQTELPWLRVLRPGFRHCFALLESPDARADARAEVRVDARACDMPGEDVRASVTRWVLYNPLSNGTQLEVWPPIPVNVLCDGLRQQGYVVLETVARPLSPRLFVWRPYTCVEAVKRVIGLHAPGVFTPWQLFRFIKNAHNRKIVLDLKG